jgi:hypothetical protein
MWILDLPFLPKYGSRGYAFEAASSVMSYGTDTLGLTRIVAITTQENQSSSRLLERLGFRFEQMIQMANDSEELKLLVFDKTESHVKKQWESSETKGILDRLAATFFDAFTNENGNKPNVSVLSELFIPEAMIIKNTDCAPMIYNPQQFIEPREKLLSEGNLVNFKEEEVHEITEIFGNIAHRFSLYRKTGVLSGKAFETMGMKTMQFIHTPSGWKISSIAWDDEKNGLTIPERYRK